MSHPQLSLKTQNLLVNRPQDKNQSQSAFHLKPAGPRSESNPDHVIEKSSTDDQKSLVLIQRCQKKIAENELFGGSYVVEYLNDQRRRCCRPSTIQNSYRNILLFITYLKQTGHCCIATATRNDLSGFIEQRQDHG